MVGFSALSQLKLFMSNLFEDFTMNMTLEQAINALSDPQYQTVDGLRALVNQVSVQVPNAINGAQTLLYSGNVGNVPAWQIAEQIGASSNNQVITINQTPVAEFLDSKEFKSALSNITGAAGFDAAYNGTINPDGTRTQGMWDIASQNLAEAATGDVRTISPFSESGKVFAATELPALLNNSNVTHIDGYPKDYFVRMKADAMAQGLSEVQAQKTGDVARFTQSEYRATSPIFHKRWLINKYNLEKSKSENELCHTLH